MILVCVGASEHPFDRLLKMVDELCDEGVLNGGEVFAQIGQTDYIPRNYRYLTIVGRDEFQRVMEKADLVITHAGTGSVVPPLKLGKKVIVFPRRKKYKEHLDDHQLEIADVFVNQGYTLMAETKEELIAAIERSKAFSPRKFQQNSGRINQIITEFIDNL